MFRIYIFKNQMYSFIIFGTLHLTTLIIVKCIINVSNSNDNTRSVIKLHRSPVTGLGKHCFYILPILRLAIYSMLPLKFHNTQKNI